jgi:hypothetical protein
MQTYSTRDRLPELDARVMVIHPSGSLTGPLSGKAIVLYLQLYGHANFRWRYATEEEIAGHDKSLN